MYSAVIVRRPIFQITNIVPSGPGASAAGGGRRVHGVCADQRRPADAAGVLSRHTHGSAELKKVSKPGLFAVQN